MRENFYRFRNDIDIDFQADLERVRNLDVDQPATRAIRRLKSRLLPHATEPL
ncbi:MAG: hypothetical protein KC900_13285 [Candidatus Omnitrophica bacterium]|nr:hypothetical protein [Candidatus Omnitrophota bacterium]